MEEKKSEQKGNIYDQLIKMQISSILNNMLSKHLKIKASFQKEIQAKLQSIKEREIDYAAIFLNEQNKQFILHLEFQSGNDPSMLYRIAEYHLLLQVKYKLPIIHYVIYMGKDKLNMENELPKELQYTGFEIFNYQEQSPETFLNSDRPEEVMLAILTKPKKVEELIDRIIQRLRELSPDRYKLNYYLLQLRIYSKLRKLDTLINQKIDDMPIELEENIEEDIFYQRGVEKGAKTGMEKGIEKGMEKGIEKGIEKGMEKGIEKGMEKGIEKGIKDSIIGMLQEGFSIPIICKITKKTEKFVLNIKKEYSL